MFPEGMKAKHSTLCSLAPILFIPHGDGKTNTYEVRTNKVQLSDKIAEKCMIFTGDEPKKSLQFFEMVSDFIR